MSNPFYAPGGQHAARVSDLFATVARRYDWINDFQSLGLHRRWKRRAVELAGVRPGDHALDLCCGTGDIAFALAARGAVVAGLDFSRPMLAVAEARNRALEIERPQGNLKFEVRRPEFLQGDAQRIPFQDASFDVVTIGYGLRNLASRETGLREMARVARPGARLIVLDFGKPTNALWRAIYFGYLKFFVPVLGRIGCGNADAYAYILESLKYYPAPSGVAAELRELGLARVQIVSLLGGAMSIHCAEKPS